MGLHLAMLVENMFPTTLVEHHMATIRVNRLIDYDHKLMVPESRKKVLSAISP
jgi:hypothetical protein